MQEEKVSSSSLFVTLTYEQPPLTENGFMTLQKTDVQDFMKRLRKISPRKLKYYYCGEYGSENKRPHYHMILFNARSEDVIKAWTLDGKSLGHVHIGTVQEASVGYTLKYMSKPSVVPLHQRDDRLPEFANMSKGLGINF